MDDDVEGEEALVDQGLLLDNVGAQDKDQHQDQDFDYHFNCTEHDVCLNYTNEENSLFTGSPFTGSLLAESTI